MSKIIVEKYEQNIKKSRNVTSSEQKYIPAKGKPTNSAANDEEFIEVIATEEVTIEDVDDVDGGHFDQVLLANRRRGFKRSTPANSAEQNSAPKENPVPSFADTAANRRAAVSGTNTTVRDPPKPNTGKLYCHYFNNARNCPHGNTCKFSHTKAPICSFDVNCDRKKCMYQHPQRSSFLERGQNQFYPPIPHPSQMSPWSMPWMFPQMDQNMYHNNQWNSQAGGGWGNQNRNRN